MSCTNLNLAAVKVEELRLGNAEVVAVYLGEQKVWPCVARTLYFNDAALNADWGTLGNWWDDAAFTVQASSLPEETDSVVISGNVLFNQGQAGPETPVPSVLGLTLVANAILDISVNVAGAAAFNNSSQLGVYGAVLGAEDSVITFNNAAMNRGSVVGQTAIFNNFATNKGNIVGDAVFNDQSANDYGSVTGTATFNDDSCDVESAGTFGTAVPNPAPACPRAFATINVSDWQSQAFQVVMGTYCGDGEWNGKPRYRLAPARANDSPYYIVFVPDVLIEGNLTPGAHWLITWAREPEAKEYMNHLWAASWGGILPPFELNWPPPTSPVVFSPNAVLQAVETDLALVASRCNQTNFPGG